MEGVWGWVGGQKNSIIVPATAEEPRSARTQIKGEKAPFGEAGFGLGGSCSPRGGNVKKCTIF